MPFDDTTALVTGANRGLGRHLVLALLDRGARHVHAAARDVSTLPDLGERVSPVRLDLTDLAQVEAAAAAAGDVTLLINNAGTAAFTGPLEATREGVQREMATNYLGTFDLVRAFAPVISRNGGGTVVNVLSLIALAAHPPMAGYSASKAAAHSLTQSLRPALADTGVAVVGAYPGGIDTEMIADFEGTWADPREIAEAILDGIEKGDEDIFPGAQAQEMSKLWARDPKAYELAFGGR